VRLIEAESHEDARSKAHAYGKRSEGDEGGTLISEGHPSTCVFAGVRRVIISAAHEADEPRLGDGDEITFLPFIVGDESAPHSLAEGQPTEVLYFEEPGPPSGRTSSTPDNAGLT
jgi:hypothetical protein